MKHIGIVAEYNPFHNGHAYQMEQIKKKFPDKQIIVIMSGNFVQRGEPAIFEKSIRAACALSSGADIVFELPVSYATASAEHFATGALRLLAATGVVDTLCFGAECDDISILEHIAELLTTEPDSYRYLLKQYLSDGYNYPKARSLALADYFNDSSYQVIMEQPNNILVIEYLKAIKRHLLAIEPVVLKREGSSYHDKALTGTMPSATALRSYIKQTFISNDSEPADNHLSTMDLSDVMPVACQSILGQNPYAKPLFFSDFHSEIAYSLWAEREKYNTFFDISEELANHLENCFSETSDMEQLIKNAAGKNDTQTGIRRSLLHILLNLKKTSNLYNQDGVSNQYLRLLGFRETAASILHEMKSGSSLPVINKVADARKILAKTQYNAFMEELHIHALYKQIFAKKYGITMPSEYQQSVIIQKV